ncbi:MAG: class I SAM-dependent methyltransferase, partial [Clostridia bacterium]|nr:class I SAM-dependent methyltransferase [Clostridia bacterium]
SLNKRLVFLQEVLDELGFGANIIHARAEEAARGELRESFDFAFARAVAQLNTLCEYCLPYVKVGGCFVAMKGKKAAEELIEAEKAIQVLGAKKEAFIEDTLPNGDERGTVILRKISQLSPKYPRAGGKIAKSPIK